MSNEESKSDKAQSSETWFNDYLDSLRMDSVVEPPREGVVYRCPCCGYKTLSARGDFEICKVCFWEDDGQDDKDADKVRGGPNGSLSLTSARANFREFGACEERFIKNVRAPLPEEL